MFDYAKRRQRLSERMDAEGVDLLFLAPSADLEYLTGLERGIPNVGIEHRRGAEQPAADPSAQDHHDAGSAMVGARRGSRAVLADSAAEL